jgi:hypothetical protein
MAFLRRYSLVVGGLVLVIVAIVLVTVPGDVLALQATFISSELHRAADSETRVRTKLDLGDAEHMNSIPKNLDMWVGLDFGSSEVAEQLGAELVLLRTYLYTGRYLPVHFIVVQSGDPTSFHAPPTCYRACGWNIEEEGLEEIPVTDASWTAGADPVSLHARKLVVSKPSSEEGTDREVVLYFYVKGRLFEDKVTMVEATADVSSSGSYDDTLQATGALLGEMLPYMFEPEEDQGGDILAARLAGSWGGIVLMVVLVLGPVALMVYPRIRRG